MVHNKKNWSIVVGVVLVMLLILATSTAWAGTCDPNNPTEEDCECRQKVLVDNEWKYRVVPLENCLEKDGDEGDNDGSGGSDGSDGDNGDNGGSGNGSKPSGSKGNASANNGKGGNYDRTGHSDNGRGNGRNR